MYADSGLVKFLLLMFRRLFVLIMLFYIRIHCSLVVKGFLSLGFVVDLFLSLILTKLLLRIHAEFCIRVFQAILINGVILWKSQLVKYFVAAFL